jgi:hypothetical protein
MHSSISISKTWTAVFKQRCRHATSECSCLIWRFQTSTSNLHSEELLERLNLFESAVQLFFNDGVHRLPTTGTTTFLLFFSTTRFVAFVMNLPD